MVQETELGTNLHLGEVNDGGCGTLGGSLACHARLPVVSSDCAWGSADTGYMGAETRASVRGIWTRPGEKTGDEQELGKP